MSLPLEDDFLLRIKTNNYSPRTLFNYERDLATFEYFLNKDVQVDFEKITKRTIELYKAYLVSEDRKTVKGKKGVVKLSAGSVNRALSSLRSYFKYLADMDYNLPVASTSVKLLKMPRTHTRVAEFDSLVEDR